MTIEVGYIDNGRGVIIRQSGVVTGKEIIAAHDNIYKQHQLHCQQYHIIDKSCCTEYDVNASEIEIIARLDCKMTRYNSNIIMAVIESTCLQFNLTDVWQAYVEGIILYSKSFCNQADALRWVKKTLWMIKYQSFRNNSELECLKTNNFIPDSSSMLR